MKSIRIALSGSGFKFPAHVGALLALRDARYKPVQYAGTSGGSIVAALAASGMDLDKMRELTLTRDWSDMLGWNPSAILSGSYCTGHNLFEWLLQNTRGKTFAELTNDLVIVASNVTTEQPFIFSKKTTPDTLVALAARASASIPLVYAPVTINDALLMDGGMEDNIPADLLTIDDIPRLGIQLTSKSIPFPPGTHSLTQVVPRLLDLILTATENAHVAIAKDSKVNFAYVETGFAGCLDCNMSSKIRHQLMASGYGQTAQELKKLQWN